MHKIDDTKRNQRVRGDVLVNGADPIDRPGISNLLICLQPQAHRKGPPKVAFSSIVVLVKSLTVPLAFPVDFVISTT